MKYKEGQEIPVTLNSIFEQGKLINTVVIVRRIIGNTIFIHIPMEFGTCQNLVSTEEQLDNMIEKRSAR